MIYKSTTVDGQKVDPQVLVDSRLTVNARWFWSLITCIDPTENYTDAELSELLEIEQRTIINLRNELESKGYILKVRSGKVITVYVGNSEMTPDEVRQYWGEGT